MITSATASVQQGLMQSAQRLNEAAASVANPDAGVNAEALIAMKIAEHGMRVNTAAAQAVYDSTEYLLDILV